METNLPARVVSSNRLRLALIALAAIAGLAIIGLAMAHGYYFLLVLPVLIPIAFVALRAPEKLIFLVIAACFLAEYGIWLVGLPSNAIYLIHLLIFTMFGAVVLRKLIAREKGLRVNFFVILWMFYLVVLLFVNSSLDVFSLQKLAVLFLYPLLFLAVLNMGKGEQFDRRVLYFLIFFVLLQFPVVIIQKIIYWNVSADRVGGTLRYAGGTHLIAILMSQFWCFAVALFLCSRKRTLVHWILLALPFIPLALGSANAGFLFAMGSGIIVCGVYFFFARTRSVLQKAGAIFIMAVPFLMAYLLVVVILPRFDPQFVPGSWGWISTINGMIEHMTGFQQEYRNSTLYTPAYRLEQIKVVASITNNLYLGSGLGSLNDSPLLGLSNEKFPQSYKLVLSWATSLTEFLMETGIVGVFLYVLAIFSLLPKALYMIRKSVDRFWVIYALGFIGMAAIIVVASVYSDSWKGYPAAGTFWICAAILERAHKRIRDARRLTSA